MHEVQRYFPVSAFLAVASRFGCRATNGYPARVHSGLNGACTTRLLVATAPQIPRARDEQEKTKAYCGSEMLVSGVAISQTENYGLLAWRRDKILDADENDRRVLV